MYKILVASIGAIGLITTTAFAHQLPAFALSTFGSETQPAAKRVVLTLSAEKKVVNGETISYEPTSGKSVQPGDILRYTVLAKNGQLPVKNLVLSQPIPKGTKYIKNSATTLAGSQLLFSIDGGKTFVARPMFGKKDAAPGTYTHLRWKFSTLMSANSQIKATYEVQVR